MNIRTRWSSRRHKYYFFFKGTIPRMSRWSLHGSKFFPWRSRYLSKIIPHLPDFALFMSQTADEL
jgi:hypothetical protein